MEKTQLDYQEKKSKVPKQNTLEGTKTYSIQGKTFIVEPVFKTDAKDTVGTILLRLIQSDNKNT